MNDKLSKYHPIPWTTGEILEATGGELLCGDLHRSFSLVSIDSRKISPDDVFVAIAGDNHDGHAFASDVVDQGVHGLVISRDKAKHLPVAAWRKNDIACIAVADTTRALGDLAAFHRCRSQAFVVAITGSNGKTTTRKLTAEVLTRKYISLATTGNRNNEIGMPLTLLGLAPEHQWVVLELGTNQPGEIARLARICSPNIGVITNIGPAHLEGLGSLEGIMQEKGDLLKYLASNGKAVLNADDPRVMILAQKVESDVLLYGCSVDATIRAEEIEENEQGISFTLVFAEERIFIHVNSPGRFMVFNALAAAGVGYLLGLTSSAVKAGLEAFQPVSGRMNIFNMPDGIHIIDDTYNANPESMGAALTTLRSMCTSGRRIFVAGDMLELGRQAQSLHNKVGILAARCGIHRLYATGEFAAALVSGAHEEGMRPADTIIGSRDEIIEDLKDWLQPGDWVLVKGSRGMAMEKVVKGLKAWGDESD